MFYRIPNKLIQTTNLLFSCLFLCCLRMKLFTMMQSIMLCYCIILLKKILDNKTKTFC